MNYISLINSFWDSATLNPLSTGQVSLYFALLHVCNRSYWTEWFTASNQVLSILTGLSRSGILKARNKLKQRGLIDFKERGTKSTLYSITISNSTQVSVQDGVQDGVQDSAQNSSTLIKHRQRQKQKKDTDVSQERFVPPTVEMVRGYCLERGNTVNPESFVNFYSSKGWMVGSNRMKDWKAAVRTWEQKERDRLPAGRPPAPNRFHNFEQRDSNYDAMMQEQVRSWLEDERREQEQSK